MAMMGQRAEGPFQRDNLSRRAERPFQRNLRRLMAEKGWKARPLSEAAGLGSTYVRDVLRSGDTVPGIDRVEKLAAVLRCSVADLLANGDDIAGSPTAIEKEARLRARAMAMVERAIGTDPMPDRAGAVFRLARLVYDVIVEFERKRGRPITDSDDELFDLLDVMVSRCKQELQ
jgi:transcriptional regulator with XRE-family HTH domain